MRTALRRIPKDVLRALSEFVYTRTDRAGRGYPSENPDGGRANAGTPPEGVLRPRRNANTPRPDPPDLVRTRDEAIRPRGVPSESGRGEGAFGRTLIGRGPRLGPHRQ